MPKPKSKNPNLSQEKNTPNNTNTSIGGNVTDSVVVVGDGNQTTFQKIINIFRGEAENIDLRNRRVMLDHMENFWIKGVLEKSLHGVALLEIGVKEDPTAVNYPWGIKKASTNETLLTEKPMLEIFKEIGLGRSLLILGAPGSGKTTMLLELTRQLIDLARQDETEPIPVVFNLASWTEKLILADWLAEQLNIFYYVPKKTAQRLVTENKMFLLLDGLDEVKADLCERCVDAINEFKNEHGLTSLVISSRIEEYQAIQTKLSLAGAITLQPLTTEQVDTYFEKFGKSLSSLKQILKKDKILRELTETPLMLSIMALAYKDVNIKEIPELKDIKEQRKHLFDTYVNRMFERKTRSEKKDFSKAETLHYLSWLANQMVKHNLITYQIEGMQLAWLKNEKQRELYKKPLRLYKRIVGPVVTLIFGLRNVRIYEIEMIDKLSWSWENAQSGLIRGIGFGLILGLSFGLSVGLIFGLSAGFKAGLSLWIIYGLSVGLALGLSNEQIDETKYPSQRLRQTLFNSFLVVIAFGLLGGFAFGMMLTDRLIRGLSVGLIYGLIGGLYGGIFGGIKFGVFTLIKHYYLRVLLIKDKVLPKRLVPFLDSCVDLIFLRRVGGSYIFVHRLIMEHFAEMYIEKENK